MIEQPPVTKVTLSDFIKQNSTLVTSFAAFIALTVFSLQIDSAETKVVVFCAALFGALLLSIELFLNLPPEPRHWRLRLFEYVLVVLLFAIGGYWIEKFTHVWAAILALVIVLGAAIAIFGALNALLVQISRRAFEFAARFYKRDLSFERFSRYLPLVTVAVTMLLCLWAFHKFSHH